jgi:hypothetical protein
MKKNNLFKFYIVAAMFLFDFAVFAQSPGDDDGTGGLEDDDAAPVPINSKLIWLAITGILFAIYVYKSYNRKEKV